MTIDPRLPAPERLTVYGRNTCEDTIRARLHFDTAGLPYRYVDLDADATSRTMLADAGYLATPTIVTPGGEVFVEPSDEALAGIVAA